MRYVYDCMRTFYGLLLIEHIIVMRLMIHGRGYDFVRHKYFSHKATFNHLHCTTVFVDVLSDHHSSMAPYACVNL